MSSDSKGGLEACSGALIGLSVIAVGLRFYARKKQKARILADDWTVLVALVTFVAAGITVIVACQEMALGFSLKDAPPDKAASILATSTKLQITLDVFSTTSLAFVKLSALSFYRRVFCVGQLSRWFNRLTITSIIVIVIWLVVFQFLTGFQCGTHLSALWDGDYLKYCTISFPFLYGLTISDFLLDVWILCLPVPLILRLNTSPAKKLSILGVFLLAFIGLAASIARMVVLIKDELGGPTYFVTHDQERTVSSYIFFVVLENGISLIAVNLPSLWFIFTSDLPERVLRSIRSMSSLFSMHSVGHGDRSSDQAADSDDRKASNEAASTASSEIKDASKTTLSTHALRYDLENHQREAYAMHELDDASTGYPKSGIHVQQTVEFHRDEP